MLETVAIRTMLLYFHPPRSLFALKARVCGLCFFCISLFLGRWEWHAGSAVDVVAVAVADAGVDAGDARLCVVIGVAAAMVLLVDTLLLIVVVVVAVVVTPATPAPVSKYPLGYCFNSRVSFRVNVPHAVEPLRYMCV